MLQALKVLPHWFFLLLVAWLGLVVGSFLGCFIYRWPRRISLWKRQRSFCPRCRAPISWYDNIPLVSWLLLRAKCRRCRQTIHWIYPLVEALTGGLFVLTYYTLRTINRFSLPVLAVYLALVAALVAVAFVDCQVRRIPNEITLPGLLLALALCVVLPEIHRFQPAALRLYSPAMGIPHRLDSLLAGVQWAFLSGGILYVLGVLWRLLRGKEAMGFGDVKLMAMVGGVLGHYAFLAIPVAAAAGTLYAALWAGATAMRHGLRRPAGEPFDLGVRISFGPLLALGTGLMIFWGPLAIAGYLRLIGTPPPVWLDYICPLVNTAAL